MKTHKMKSSVDEVSATVDELWDYCLREYENSNPIAKLLFSNFYCNLSDFISVLDADARLLEVGCGAGFSSMKINELLTTQHFEVSDYDERYVRRLRESAFPLRVQQESILALNREDSSFDCVICLEVLEHIGDFQRALSELFRVTRKWVVLSVPNEPLWHILNLARGMYWREFGNTPGHINHWSPSKFRRLVSEYGTVYRISLPPPWIMVLAEKKGYCIQDFALNAYKQAE